MNLICGINPVLEALGAGTRHFDRLMVVKGLRNQRISEAIARASQMGVPLRFEARETLDRMAGGIPHQGVIAVVSPKAVVSLESLLSEARDPALVVVLDGVEDPRNLGAILRSAEGAGADGVLLPDRHSAGLSDVVARASAGALEHVRVARIGNVAQALDALKERGLWVVGLDAEGHERWDAVDYKGPVALVLGGEGKGMRRLVKERCDHVVSLPLFGHVTSLNVSVAAGVVLYEVVRQRGAVPSHVRPIPPRASAPPSGAIGPDPGDAEHDPGDEPYSRIHHAAPGSHADGDAEPHEDSDADRGVTFAAIHEEAAWSGPTIMKETAARRRLRDGGRHDRGRRPRPPAAERGSSEAGAVPGGAAAPSGRRRRRRRRGRPPGDAPQGAGAPDGGTPPAPEGQREGTPNDGGGRRRRRRRRHRRPME